VPFAELGPTLMPPLTAALTPVAGEAVSEMFAPFTVTSPMRAEVAFACSDSDGTPLRVVSVPENWTGAVVIPGIVNAVEDSVTDQFSRFVRVPVNPIVEVLPERRTS